MTIDILICSYNKGIVRMDDVLLPPQEGIHYIVSYQYSDERYLDLIPKLLLARTDVTIFKYKGQGLSVNRNLAIEKASADLIMFADDDTHLSPNAFEEVRNVFEKYPDLDIAFFNASTYTGKPLKKYPKEEMWLTGMPQGYTISAIEIAAKRECVQNRLRFDERFGLGTKFLTCGEEEIWMENAVKAGLKMRYFPIKTVETSTLLKKSLLYIDAGVQRSFGAVTYYKYGKKAWLICFNFALQAAKDGYCHFWPMMRHFAEGIRYMKRTK